MCAPLPASSAPAPFAYDDLFRLVSLGDPQLSPDGRRVALIVSRIDRAHDRSTDGLDLIDVAGGGRRVLDVPRAGLADPHWSPRGDRIAFIARASGTHGRPQVWVYPLGDGRARRVTAAPSGVEQFAWRPDGASLAYVAVDPQPKRTGDDRFIDAYHVGNDPALATRAALPARIWLQPLSGAAPRLLTPGAGSVTSGEAESTLSFSPDGATLAYLHGPNNVLNDADQATVHLIDVASGRDRALGLSRDHDADPMFSPDGAHIAYTHSDGDGQVHPSEAYIASVTGAENRSVSRAVDRVPRGIGWEPDGRALDFVAADGTKNVLFRAPLDGPPQRVEVGSLSIESAIDGALGRDGAFAFVGSWTDRPSELYYSAPGAAPRALTHFNDAQGGRTLATSERITYHTTTGVKGDAVLVRPPGFVPGHRYPLVLVLHGGPAQTSTQSWNSRAQLLAANGWLVLEPNYRGSTNAGVRYQSAIYVDKVVGPAHDIRAALDAVKARGIVDDARVAVSGWSYGGGLTTWLVSHYHDWRCAVAGAPVTDIIADYATADDIDADRELLRGSPWLGTNRTDYLAQSPITYVGDVTTPLLLMSDRGDRRVSPVGAYEFYHALRDLGKPVELVVYPVDGHYPGDPVRSADVSRRWAAYIAQHFAR